MSLTSEASVVHRDNQVNLVSLTKLSLVTRFLESSQSPGTLGPCRRSKTACETEAPLFWMSCPLEGCRPSLLDILSFKGT